MATRPDTLITSDYVICATLRKIPDVFNIELLWERARGTADGVCLSEALQRYPRSPRSRSTRETYYNQVLVRIPERDYMRDLRLEDGQGRHHLITAFQQLHQEIFGTTEEGEPRYRVEPDSNLRAGEAQFLFGRAIHVPSAEEMALFRIEAAAEGRNEWRDLGPIYPQQRLTLLGSDRRTSSFPIMAWPFTKGEAVLLILRSAASGMVDVVAEPPECLSLVDDAEGGFIARDRRRGLRLRIAAQQNVEAKTSTAPPRRPSAHSSAPAAPQATPTALEALEADYPQVDIWGRREPVFGISSMDLTDMEEPVLPVAGVVLRPEAAPAELHTLAPSGAAALNEAGTWIPQRPKRIAPLLKVVGVALQRLSTYANVGIRDWRLRFNQDGSLVLAAQGEGLVWLRVDSKDRVFGESAAATHALDFPSSWPALPHLTMQLHSVPPALAEHYLGWVVLPVAFDLPLPRGRAVSFGRGKEADIAPKLLADPQALRWQGQTSAGAGISAEYLGLSRRHLRLQTRDDAWWVELESQNMAAYRLAADGTWLETLTPGVNTATAAQPGELLVAGGYVLELGALDS